jgi:hypothetical protein
MGARTDTDEGNGLGGGDVMIDKPAEGPVTEVWESIVNDKLGGNDASG